MSDLISREALREDFYELEIHGTMAVKAVLPIIEERIDNLPAVDAVEVVHAKWERLKYVNGWARCSRCESTWELEKIDAFNMTFCPNCGARMQGGSDE